MSATILVRVGRRYYKAKVNPLVKSRKRSSVNKRKQAIAIALSVWRKAASAPVRRRKRR